MGEHRVLLRGATLRRYEDPAVSSDPRIRGLVAQLAALDPGPSPRPHFRAELRAQLVAVAPRLVAEGPAVERLPGRAAGVRVPAAKPRRAVSRLTHVPVGRPLAVVASVFAVFVMLLGGAVLMSGNALPGDALYALKRANENVQLSFTHGTDRAKTYLSFASTRADEVDALLADASSMAVGTVPTAAGGINAHTATLVRSTLASADDDVRSASQILGAEAVKQGSNDPLTIMTDWAPGQIDKLEAITARIPAGPLQERAAQSQELVEQALDRAVALQGVVECQDCFDNAPTDDLGPSPSKITRSPSPTTTTPGTSPTTGATTGGSSSTQPGGSPTDGSAPASATPSASVPLPLPTLPLPTLPLPTTGPVVVDSCGVSASLGPIGVGIGTCGVNVGVNEP